MKINFKCNNCSKEFSHYFRGNPNLNKIDKFLCVDCTKDLNINSNVYPEEQGEHNKTVLCKCSCGNIFKMYLSKFNKTNNIICPSCSRKIAAQNNMTAGNCTHCGNFSQKRDIAGLGFDCNCAQKMRKRSSQANKQAGNCLKCNKYSKERNIAGLCKDCMKIIYKGRHSEGICVKCGDNDILNFGLCKKCNKDKNLKIIQNKSSTGNCTICGKLYDRRNAFGVCIKCNNFKDNLVSFKNNEFYNFNLNLECNNKCKAFNHCKNKDILKNKWGWCKNSPNLNNIYTYEDSRVTSINGVPLNDFFGFQITGFYLNKTIHKITCNDQVACRWKTKGDVICPLTEEEYSQFYNIYTRVNGRITHVNGTPISDLYSVIETRLDFDIDSKYPGFFIKTGLPRDYIGDFYGKEAFDQSLCEKGVGHFVYIKFYNDNGVRKPLSVCKSTTRLVSDSTNDVDFSYYNKKQTLSRQFLNDKSLKWWTEEIYIIPISEEDYNGDCSSATCPSFTEQLIYDEFGLFY